MTAAFSAREVAEFANVPVRTVDKAVEEEILVRGARSRRRPGLLPLHAIPYAALVKRLPVVLERAEKLRLARNLAAKSSRKMTREPVEIAPALIVDVSRLVDSGLAERAERYAETRDRTIVRDPEILGGTPLIKGTRLSVYAIRGRIDGGETYDALIEDYPELDREAVEAAVLYARTHPMVGRPAKRPWHEAA